VGAGGAQLKPSRSELRSYATNSEQVLPTDVFFQAKNAPKPFGQTPLGKPETLSQTP